MNRPSSSFIILISALAGAALGLAAAGLLEWRPFGQPGRPEADRHEPGAAGERRVLYWRAPMDPNYRSEQPGKSPMGMDLIPVYADAAAEPMREGAVRVSKQFLQNFSVRTAEVKRGDLTRSIRTVGILAHNDEKVFSVNTKFDGWIERAEVNNVGEFVQQGDVLFEIYSPELVTTQREYLASMDYVKQLRDAGAQADAVDRARSLLRATRERLRHWDVTEAQIAALETAGAASRTLPFLAPASGLVVAKVSDSLDGLKLAPGMTVLKIADHSTLWVEAQLDEQDVRHVFEGSPAFIEVEAFPERRWRGKIRFFRSALSAETRALTAFVEIDNPDLALRPMMYVNVTIEAEGARDALLAPAESVLRSGARSVVIVDRGGGVFEPREVALGLTADGQQEIKSGLAAGERVLVSSQFLIDSESNLQAATAQLLRGTEGSGDAAASNDAGATPHHQAHH